MGMVTWRFFLPTSIFLKESLNYFFDLPIRSEVGVMEEILV